jgi:hypothetical protein
MKQLNVLLTSFFLFLVGACGGGGGGGSSTSEDLSEQIRFINAVKSESALDIKLGDNIFVEELAYGESSGFIEVPEDKVQLRVNSSERVVPILSSEETIASGSKQTFLLLDEASVLSLQAIEEKPTKPLVGDSSVRLVNMSEEKTPVDVYIVFPSEDLDDQIPAVSDLAFKSLSDYISFRSGTYDIVYTEAGSSKIIRRATEIKFTEGKIYTHILLDQIGAAIGQTSRIYEDSLF